MLMPTIKFWVLHNLLIYYYFQLFFSFFFSCFQGSQSSVPAEHSNRVFGRFRSRHQRGSSLVEESLGCRTVDLRTSTIKIDAEDTDLRLCFRIISPSKTYTFQVKFLVGFQPFNSHTLVFSSPLFFSFKNIFSGLSAYL